MDCTQRIVDDIQPSKKKVATLYALGTNYSIFSGINNIGRDPDKSDIFIDNSTISKNHAVIRVLGGEHVILDLGSTNKTIINSEITLIPYDQYQLKDACSVQFGEVRGQYYFDQCESQLFDTLPNTRPTNPLEKILDLDTESGLDTQNNTEDLLLERSSSPIIDGTKRKTKIRRGKLPDSLSIHEAETQVVSDGKNSQDSNAAVSIQEAETQVISAVRNSQDNMKAKVSIHEAETQIPVQPDNLIWCNKKNTLPCSSPHNSSTEHLRLSESLNEDNIHTSDAHVPSALQLSSFCIPETQDVASTFLKGDLSKNVSIDESDCDRTNRTEPNIDEDDSNEIISYKDDSLSDCNYDNISSQCLLRSFTALPQSVFATDEDHASLEGTTSDVGVTVIENNEPKSFERTAVPQLPKSVSDMQDDDLTDCEDDVLSNTAEQDSSPVSKSKIKDTGTEKESTTDNIEELRNSDQQETQVCDILDDVIIPDDLDPNNFAFGKPAELPCKKSMEDVTSDKAKQNVVAEEIGESSKSLVDQGEIFDQPTQIIHNNTNKNVINSDDISSIFDAPTQAFEPVRKPSVEDDFYNMCTQAVTKQSNKNRKSEGDDSGNSRSYDIFTEPTQKVPSKNTKFKKPFDTSVSNQRTLVVKLSPIKNPVISPDKAKKSKQEETLNNSLIEQSDDADDIYDQTTQIFPCAKNQKTDGSPGKTHLDNTESCENTEQDIEDIELSNDSIISEIGSVTKNSNICSKIGTKSKKYVSSTPMITDAPAKDQNPPNAEKKSKENLFPEGKTIDSKSTRTSLGVTAFKESLSEHESENLEEDSDSEMKAECSMYIYAETITKQQPKVRPKDLFGDSSESETENVAVVNTNILYGKSPIPKKQKQQKKTDLEPTRKGTRTRQLVKHFDDLFGDSEQTDDGHEVAKPAKRRNTNKTTSKIENAVKNEQAPAAPKRSKRSKQAVVGDTAETQISKAIHQIENTATKKPESVKRQSRTTTKSSPRISKTVINDKVVEEVQTSTEDESNVSVKSRASRRGKAKEQKAIKKEKDWSDIKLEPINESARSTRHSKIKEVHFLSESSQDSISVSGGRRTSKRKPDSQDNLKDSIAKTRSRRQTYNIQQNSTSCELSPKRPKASEDNSLALSVKLFPRTSIRKQPKDKHRILFTSVNDDNLVQLVETLGGSVVDSHNKCTILIAPRIVRTVKFLCCLAKGIPIVSVDWLTQSSKADTYLDPWEYITSDKAGESKYKFDLKKSLKRAQSTPLLKGYTVMGTMHIVPQLKEMQEIVESSGGRFISSVPSRGFKEPAFVISCEQDKEFWPKTSKKFIPPIVKAECLLIGVLQQKLNVPLHLLT